MFCPSLELPRSEPLRLRSIPFWEVWKFERFFCCPFPLLKAWDVVFHFIFCLGWTFEVLCHLCRCWIGGLVVRDRPFWFCDVYQKGLWIFYYRWVAKNEKESYISVGLLRSVFLFILLDLFVETNHSVKKESLNVYWIEIKLMNVD